MTYGATQEAELVRVNADASKGAWLTLLQLSPATAGPEAQFGVISQTTPPPYGPFASVVP